MFWLAAFLPLVAASPLVRRDGNITLTPAQLQATTLACKEIAGNVSSASAVYYPASVNYVQDIAHYSTVRGASMTTTDMRRSTPSSQSAPLSLAATPT